MRPESLEKYRATNLKCGAGWKKSGVAGVLTAILAATSALAADLPSAKEPIPYAPVVEDFQPFFVKIGVTYAINTSTSSLAGQNPTLLARGNGTLFPAGVGATIDNVTTVGFEAGYFVTHNISLNVSGGIPFYVKDRTKGYNPQNPLVPNGTVLSQIMPAIVPITAVYHFDNFGPVRPFLGVGFAPGFSFSNKNAFLGNVAVGGAVGLVLQAGADYMFDRHWGLSFDVKKVFAYVGAHSSQIAIPGVGYVPTVTTQTVNFQPWLLSTGIVYRFGGSESVPVVAKY
jgi:outer membrane protein